MLIHCSNWSITGFAFWLLAKGIKWFERQFLCPEPIYPQSWAAFAHVCPCWHAISAGGAFPRRSEAELMGTRMCLAWCNLAGKGGHSQSGLGSVASSHLPCLCCGARPPLGKQSAGGAWLSLPRPVGVSLGKADLVLVQQTLWPQADGDGCGFPFSPPFLLAEAHGWGELCVAHCGRISPLGIAFWHGDPRRQQLTRGRLLRVQLLSTWRSSFTSRSCPGHWGSRFWATCECYASSPSAWLLEGSMEEGMFWQCLEVGFTFHPQESCGSDSSSPWQGTSQVNTACAASSGTLQGKTVSLVDLRLEFKWFSGFAAGQLCDAASHRTCLCLSFSACRALECALSSSAGLKPLQGAALLLWASEVTEKSCLM